MANAWLYIGSFAVSVALLVYQFYKNREQPHSYEHDQFNDDDFIEINGTDTSTTNLRNSIIRTMPGTDELCTICQDHLIRKNPTKKYCLVSLPICGHWFHQKCALRLLEYHPMCPVCRISIDRSMITNTVRVSQQHMDESGDSSSDNNSTTKRS